MSGFTGLGFVATWQNADPTVIAPLGVVRSLAAKVAHGLTPVGVPAASIGRARETGLDVVPWAWCDANTVDEAKAEGRYHVERCAALGLTAAFVANPEESYDAHGNSSSPRYHMVSAYVDAFQARAIQLGLAFKTLGLTSTPRFASDMTRPIGRGWVGMPQAFPLAVPGATIAACVDHWNAWGWPNGQLRPLVQVFSTDGQRPDPQPFLHDAAAAAVGVVPYVVEQALDEPGKALLAALKPATMRPTGQENTPPMPELIGFQSGIRAFCNDQRDQGAATLLKQVPDPKHPDKLIWQPLSALDETPLGKWPAIDKLERTLTLLAADHDTRMSA